jgi:hypothetical protein
MVNQTNTKGANTVIWQMCLCPAMTAFLGGTLMFFAANSAYSQTLEVRRPTTSLSNLARYRGNSEDTTKTSPASTGSFIVFDVPGSTCKESFVACTTTFGINDEGTVVGSYADANQAFHGFLRLADGTFLNIDVPGTTCTTEYSTCTTPTAINPAGTVAGWYCNAVNCYGFLRDLEGRYTSFAPTDSQFILVNAISSNGEVTGQYCNGSSECPSFVRDRHGNFTTFEAPGAVNGTSGASINDQGEIVGTYLDANYVNHGFRRDYGGHVTSLDPPDAANIYPVSINDVGEIAGYYVDVALNEYGFLLTCHNHYADITGYPVAINLYGAIAGQNNGSGEAGTEGFYRDRSGNLSSFLPPNALYITVAGLNSHGTITGSFIDSEYLQHGFIWRDN